MAYQTQTYIVAGPTSFFSRGRSCSWSKVYMDFNRVERSGIRSTFQFTGEAKRSKGLRKFYKTTAELAGMKPINVEITHGHSVGMSDNYYRPTVKDLLEDYVNTAADALTISEEPRLRKRNEELQRGYLAELGDLRHDFNEMKQLLVHLSKDSQKELVDEFFQKVGDKADIEWSCDD
jgi:hypothetical protein